MILIQYNRSISTDWGSRLVCSTRKKG